MNFFTIFPEANNVHLIKDVGMIPYVLQKEYNFTSYIASYSNKDLSYLENEVKGLRHKRIYRICKKAIINVSIFLIKESHKIDVLNVYHLTEASMIWIRLYKLLNRNGKVYLKFDTNFKVASRLLKDKTTKNKLRNTFKLCTVISCETEDVKELFEKEFGCEIKHLSNGVLEKDIHINPSYKKRIIMTVGRLGTPEKNTELLVDAFVESIPYIDVSWNLVLVGEMTKAFEEYILELINQNNLQNRIIIKGKVNDRDVVGRLYEQCMIFVMPSKWEGFSLAGVEALGRGDYILASDLQCFKEMTDDNTYGTLFLNGNKEDLKNKMICICNSIEQGERVMNYDRLREYVYDRYTWEGICRRIVEALEYQ